MTPPVELQPMPNHPQTLAPFPADHPAELSHPGPFVARYRSMSAVTSSADARRGSNATTAVQTAADIGRPKRSGAFVCEWPTA